MAQHRTGANVVWYLNGTTLLGQASLPAVPDLAWRLSASADVNLDGHLDLIWRNRQTGANVIWYLNGTTLVGAANLPTVPDTNWQIVASADINRDGHPDLIWRNTRTRRQRRLVSGRGDITSGRGASPTWPT